MCWRFWKSRQQDTFGLSRFGEVAPNFLGGKRKDWSHQFYQTEQKIIEGTLGTATFTSIRPGDVKTVLENIQIQRGQLYGTKLVQAVIDQMKFKFFIGLTNPGNKFGQPGKGHAIQLLAFARRKIMLAGVKIIEVALIKNGPYCANGDRLR